MQSNTKDKILGRRGDDTSDSDSSVPEMSCDTCGLEFPSMKAYVAHVNGKKHSKKIAREKLVTKLLKEGNEKDGTKDLEDDDDDSSELHCDVCDKSFSGHVSYMTHLKSNVHAKYVKKQKLKEKMANMPEVLDKDDKDEGEADYGIIPKPYARCTTCQKEFSGPEPFAAHMKSLIHKKKIEMSKLDISKHQESKISDEEGDIFAKCDACQKSFSGPIPYHTHMLSNVHKKSLEKKKVAEEMKKICEEYDPETGFTCKECKKAFTDPLMFKNHLANNNHEKQKAKEALKEFLSKFPEITFVAPFGYYNDDHNDKSDSEDSDQEFYLICKICQMSFSGPESAQAHVKSKKHVKNKKDKLLLKLINEQKKGVNKSEKNVPEFTADGKVKTDNSVEKIKNGDLSGKIKTGDSRGINKSGVSSRTEATTVLKDNEADDFEHI